MQGVIANTSLQQNLFSVDTIVETILEDVSAIFLGGYGEVLEFYTSNFIESGVRDLSTTFMQKIHQNNLLFA